MADPIVSVLKAHMRVSIGQDDSSTCLCGEIFKSGDLHREHVALLIREALGGEQ